MYIFMIPFFSLSVFQWLLFHHIMYLLYILYFWVKWFVKLQGAFGKQFCITEQANPAV